MDRINHKFFDKLHLYSDFLMFGPYDYLKLRNYINSQHIPKDGTIKCFGEIFIGDVCLNVTVTSENEEPVIKLEISLPVNEKLSYLHDVNIKLPVNCAIEESYTQFIHIILTQAARINHVGFRHYALRKTGFWDDTFIVKKYKREQ